MTTLQNGDSFLVQRTDSQSGISTNYQVSQENLMANLADDDLLLVQRTSAGISTNYCISGSDLKEDLGGTNGLIRPPVAVLTPLNGSGITEFTQYEPLSSAITAVGEAGTITKDTDEILSVSASGTQPVEVYYMTSAPTNLADVLTNGATYVDGQSLAAGSKIVFVRTGSGTGQVFSSNGTVGFTLYSHDGGGFFAADGTYLAGGGSYNNGEYTLFNYDDEDPSTASPIYKVQTHASVAYTVLCMSGGTGPTLNAASITTLKTLSFPTNTNFSGLSVGDVVQGNALNGTVSVTQGYTFTDGRGDLDKLFDGVVTGNGTTDWPHYLVQFNDAGGLPGTLTFDPPLVARSGTLKAHISRYSSGTCNYTVNGSINGSFSATPTPSIQETGVSSISTFTFPANAGNAQLWGFSDGEGVIQHVDNVNITAIDASGPSQQEEYVTLNPDDKHSGINLSNGNLTNVGTTTNVLCRATKSFSSGKWYYEATLETHGGNPIFGWADGNHNLSYLGNDGVNKGYGYAAGGGLIYSLGGNYAYGVNFSAGTVLGVAADLDAGTIEYFVNGNSQGVAFNNVSGELYPAFSSGANSTVHFNFGATPFTYTPPSGYVGISETVTTYPSVTVAGGNWDASNQSQIWSNALQSSSGWVYQPTSAFDGIGNEGAPYTYAQVSVSGSSITFTPSTPITYSESISIYMASAGGTASINGAAPVAVANSVDSVIASGSGTLTSLVLNASNSTTLMYIKVDGEFLIDPAEDSQVWSSFGTGTHYGSRDWSKAFDGVISDSPNGHTFANSSQTLTWTPPSPITVNESVVLYGLNDTDNSTYGIKLNGGSNFVQAANSGVYGTPITILANDIGGSLSSISLINNASNYGPYLTGVQVDGKLLIDAGVRDFGDRKLSSSISYEKSLTFTDTTELANMVGPLEMTDANGDVVTPVSDTIANVSGNTLTLASDTNLEYFQPGDEVQTGVQVVSVDENAPSITVDGGSWYGADGTGGTYEISKSLRFNSADSAYLSRDFPSAGNRKTWTWSGWVKMNPGSISGYNLLWSATISGTSDQDALYLGTDDRLHLIFNNSDPSGATFNVFTTNRLFRDPSAFYHLLLIYDATASGNYVKLYVNGIEETSFYTDNRNNAALSNHQSSFNAVGEHRIGKSHANDYLNAYLADVHFVDGQALAPTTFGDFDSNGVWQAKEADISSPNNGITWSNYITISEGNTGSNYNTDAANMFDGDTSTSTALFSGDMISPYSPTTVVFTPPSAMTVNTGIRVYMAVNRQQKIFVNGNETNASVTAGWNDVAFTGTLTSLTIGPTQLGSSSNINAIEIDGVVLIDGATAYGTNGFHLDFSDSSSDAALGYDAAGSNNWTVNNLSASSGYINDSVLTGSIYAGAGDVDKMFDGTTAACGPTANAYVTFTPSTPITINSSLRIRANVSNTSVDADFAINGTSVSTVSAGFPGSGFIGDAASTWTTISNPPSSLTSLRFGWPSGGSWMSLSGIEVDGVVLTDVPGADNDSLVDTPTNYGSDTGTGGEVRGNYATLNPLQNISADTFSNGNLQVSTSVSGYGTHTSTIATPLSGKWYAEVTVSSSSQYSTVGLVAADSAFTTTSWAGELNGVSYLGYNGNKYVDGPPSSSYGATFGNGDTIGIAYDADSSTVVFYKNGVSQGTISSVPLREYYFGGSDYDGNGEVTYVWNFGQRSWAFAPPSGYQALTTANLPEPTIKDGSKHFDVVTFTGSSSGGSFTIPNFEPDLIWCKNRDGSLNHILQDSVRGFGNYKSLYSNLALGNDGNNGGTNNIMSVSGSTVNYGTNSNFTGNMVAWAWNAGDTTETIAAGDLNSSLYDQSQTWSNNAVTTGNGGNWSNVTNLFDGNLSTYAHANIDASAVTVTLTFSPPLPATSGVKVWGGMTNNNVIWRVNNETNAPFNSANYNSVENFYSFSGNISTITIENSDGTNNSSGLYLYGVEVDGKMLVDSGVSVASVPSIASEVRANPAAGFSVVTWTGTATAGSVAHGLNSSPGMILLKNYGEAADWRVWHKDLSNTATDYLELNKTSGSQSSSAIWNNTAPTSSVFNVATDGHSNSNGKGIVAYCFAPVEGFSAMGSYTGNGLSGNDSPFIYTGFKPAFLIIKRTDSADHWYMYDDERNGYNPANEQLTADLSDAEYSSSSWPSHDFLSNGFKLRTTNAGRNASGGTYIYIALAENPLNTPPEVDTSGDTQVSLDPLAAIATEIVETDGTTMYLNGATGPWRTGLSIEGSQINAAPPGPNEVTFTSTDNGTTPVSMINATLSTRTWTLESGTTATGPWTLIDSYTDFDAIDSQDGATPWTTTRPTLQPNTFYRVKVRYDSLNADSVESVYSTFKTGDA